MPIPHPPATPRWLPWLAAVAFFLQTLDGTILNTALPGMARALGVAPLALQPVVVAYLLTATVCIPASGWLADRFGTRRVFMAALTLFGLGSLAAALAPSVPALVAARVLQGAGGALMLPVARLAVLRSFPRDELINVLSLVAMAGLVGPLLGPPLGGMLVQWASWRWIFIVNLPVVALGLVLARRHMPDLRHDAGRFDALGFGLFATAVVGLTVGLGEGGLPRPGWLAAAALALALFVWHTRRARRPLFAPSLLRVRSFAVGLSGNLWARLGSGAMPFVIPLYLQLSLGWPPARAGLALVPVVLGAMAAKVVAPSLVRRLGYRRVLVGNTLTLGVLIALFAMVGTATPTPLLLTLLAAFGLVNSMQFSAMNTVTLMELDAAQAGGGNALLSVVMQLSASLGVSSATLLLGAFGGVAVPGAFAATFLALALLAAGSAAVFGRLPADASPRRQ